MYSARQSSKYQSSSESKQISNKTKTNNQKIHVPVMTLYIQSMLRSDTIASIREHRPVISIYYVEVQHYLNIYTSSKINKFIYIYISISLSFSVFVFVFCF